MIYFIADLHLGHDNIIELCNRPFSTIEEMDETIINNWNKKIHKNDTIYILGDMIWEDADPTKYLSQLEGKKILIIGNHDIKWLNKGDYSSYFEKIVYMDLIPAGISPNGHTITLCHYPMLEWQGSRKIGSRKEGYHIYGHIHARVSKEYQSLYQNNNAYNAGVDINNFTPVTIEELKINNELFKKKFFE